LGDIRSETWINLFSEHINEKLFAVQKREMLMLELYILVVLGKAPYFTYFQDLLNCKILLKITLLIKIVRINECWTYG